jgi:hypothetical protein
MENSLYALQAIFLSVFFFDIPFSSGEFHLMLPERGFSSVGRASRSQ